MSSTPGPGPKREALQGAKAAAKAVRARMPKRTVAKSIAYTYLRDLGVPADRLKALSRVWRDGITADDVLVFAADLLFEARAAMYSPSEDMSAAKAAVQAAKAIELIAKVLADREASAVTSIQLVVRMAMSDEARANNSGNGVRTAHAGELPE